jgi:hypothetical protein
VNVAVDVHSRDWPVVAGVIVAVATTAAASALLGPIVPAALIGLTVLAAAAWRPILAVYIYVVTLPFIAGIGRGKLVPLVRPNEALLAAMIAGVLIGWYIRYVTGHDVKFRFTRLDVVLAAFVALSIVWPICSLLLRGKVPSFTEVMALFPMAKLAGLFVLVRVAVPDPPCRTGAVGAVGRMDGRHQHRRYHRTRLHHAGVVHRYR